MKVYVELNPSQPYVDNLLIDCVELILEKSARFQAIYQNKQDVQLNIEYVMMDGYAYEDWGDSDQYAIDYVLNALGFVEKSQAPSGGDGYDN